MRVPAVVSRSLSEIGTPWNGASAGSSAFACASASASSPRTVTYAPSCGIEPLDPLQVELDELDRRDLPLPDEPSLLGRGEERELVHRASLSAPPKGRVRGSPRHVPMAV